MTVLTKIFFLNEKDQILNEKDQIFNEKVQIFNENINFFQGNAQISLAEFNNDDISSKWYNIISMVNPETICSAFKEESSDESTIISSQTSTLTRDQNHVEFQLAMNMQDQLNINSDNEEENDDEDDSDRVYGDLSLDQVQLGDNVLFNMYGDDNKSETGPDAQVVDKETNTECAFLPEKRRERTFVKTTKDAATEERVVKRSQTFSPR